MEAVRKQQKRKVQKDMAHNIQTRDVQVGLQQAWHGKTKVVEKVDADSVGILYGMAIAETYYKDTDGKEQKSNGRQIFATDDGLPVGRAVGDDYTLISNKDMWEALHEGLVDVKHEIVSAGTVNNRSLGFASVKFQDGFVAANRETDSVLNFLWGHGGNRSVIAKTGFTVVVCENTFNMALGENGDFSVSTRHTRNCSLDKMKKSIELHFETTEAFKAEMQRMESREVKQPMARAIYAGFMNRDGKSLDTKNSLTRLSNTVDALEALFVNGKGNRGSTMADVFNGYTDLLTHGNGKNPWKSYVSSEFGRNGDLKGEFFNVLTDEKRLADTIARGEKTLLEV